MGGENKKSVEPASSLVDTLANKVCWVSSFEELLVLEWIVLLSIRHAVVVTLLAMAIHAAL
jgi:hypothetical protein